MTTSHVPAVALDGGVNVHVIHVGDCTLTFVAVILGLSALNSATVAPDWKFEPVREVMDIAVPASPKSGTIFLKVGFPVGETVAVVVVDVEVVWVVDPAVAVVVGTVGVRITIEAGGLLVIFSVYAFSMTARAAFSVLEFLRYPQLPSVLG
jgi:hypothetical protein